MGVVGANGAGKSTLLRILAQITQPTEGKVVLGGRVASVLGVGPGFHPELTGRENLFLSGSILGMSRREILERVNDIASFAGVAQALESPVKQFSTGMRARLALSLACHIDPDILLVDETLAVGDLAFQQKCLQRIMEVGRKGGIIVLVTHDLNVVREYCNSALFFRGGQIVAGGDPAGVLSTYAKGG